MLFARANDIELDCIVLFQFWVPKKTPTDLKSLGSACIFKNLKHLDFTKSDPTRPVIIPILEDVDKEGIIHNIT